MSDAFFPGAFDCNSLWAGDLRFLTNTAGHFDEEISLGRLNAAVTQLTVGLVPWFSTNGAGRIYATNLNVIPNVLLGLKRISGIPFLHPTRDHRQPGLETSTSTGATTF